MPINGVDIHIINATAGQLLRQLILNPTVDYQARAIPEPRPEPNCGFELFLCRATSHGAPGGDWLHDIVGSCPET
jgi:hypothetical protein